MALGHRGEPAVLARDWILGHPMTKAPSRQKLLDQIAEWIGQRQREGADPVDLKMALIAGAMYLCGWRPKFLDERGTP